MSGYQFYVHDDFRDDRSGRRSSYRVRRTHSVRFRQSKSPPKARFPGGIHQRRNKHSGW